MAVETFDIGNIVVCDFCSKDYTLSDENGGLLFQSKGVCPKCAPGFLKRVRQYGEERFIRATANEGEAFRDFIIRIRGGNNTVRVTGGADAVKEMAAIIRGVTGQ